MGESWEKVGRKLGEKLGVRLGVNEEKILQTIFENPNVTIAELSKQIGISTTAIDKNIKKLKDKKALLRIGGDKGGYWKILK